MTAADPITDALAAWWPRPSSWVPRLVCPKCGERDTVLIVTAAGAVGCPECRVEK